MCYSPSRLTDINVLSLQQDKPTQAMYFMVGEWYKIVKRDRKRNTCKTGDDSYSMTHQDCKKNPKRDMTSPRRETQQQSNRYSPRAHSFVNFDATTSTSKSTQYTRKSWSLNKTT